jgi:eukaryotic-like serine/threonine-protein kinase
VSARESSGEVVPLRGRVNVETVGYDLAPAARTDGFTRPTQIGRYQILDVIGMGGMGVVCTAYDAKLDRKVAIKLLRDAAAKDSRRRSMGQARLVREAQALAKLSHPNVITVHDVDTWEDNLYMAMEYVEGRSIAEWMEEARRPWQDVVKHFIAAGRGLAAAHAAGIIHRDFKPHNVLLGNDGRVRVVDFGLAKSAEEARSIRDTGDEVRASPLERSAQSLMQFIGSASDAKLTQLGRAVGTPAYMAPEQHLGDAMSEATDQFSFGVSLYEALYGDLPFRGKDPFWEATAGKVCEPPDGTEVPTWLHQVLLRTLAPAPKDRFPSMEALIAAIGDDPAKRRRRWLMGAGVLGVGVVGAMVGVWAIGGDKPCQGATARLADAWTPERQAAVRDAFEQTGLSYATDTWERVAPTLDAHASTWRTEYKSICEATHVRGEQSEALLDVRMRCLDRRRGELAALVDVLAEADPKVVEQAIAAAHALSRPESCASVTKDAVTLPDDPELRLRIEVAESELDRVLALLNAGRYPSAATLAAGVVQSAEALRHAPTRARALLLSGKALMQTGDGEGAQARLQEAVLLAAQTGDAKSEAEAWIALIFVVGALQQHHDTGLAWEMPARAALRRVEDGWPQEADLSLNLGVVLTGAGRLTDALEIQQDSLEVAREVYGPDHPQLQAIIGNLGITHARLGHFDDAEPLMREALSLSRRALGHAHPSVAKNAQNLGNIVLSRGDLAEAARLFEEALSIHQKALGDDHPLAIDVMIQLGRVHRDRGEHEAAEALIEQALRLSETSGNEARAEDALKHLGFVLMRSGRHVAAEQRFRAALEYSRRIHGPEHWRTAKSSYNVCRSLLEQSRPSEAQEYCDHADELFTATHETAHMDTALAKLARARALVVRHRGSAVELAREGMRLARDTPASEAQITLAEVDLARVLEEAGSHELEVAEILERARPVANLKDAIELRTRLAHWN